MTVGSLFSGIGGFDLGLERAGFTIRWQVENDAYCNRVLRKHWPDVVRYGDIRTVEWALVEPVDLVCGGPPCQPVSVAGKRKGTADERWLWPEFARCLRVLRPRYVFIENVPGLLTNGFDAVLGDLADLGYDAEWQVLSAAAFGAPHLRKRVWIVAYREGHVADSEGAGRPILHTINEWKIKGKGDTFRHSSEVLADAEGSGTGTAEHIGQSCKSQLRGQTTDVADTSLTQSYRWSDGVGWWKREPQETLQDARRNGRQEDGLSIPESILGRVAHGVPHQVDRLRGLGNAVVPQVVEWIGKQIIGRTL